MKEKNLNRNLDIHWNKVLIVGNRSYRNLWDELILLWTIKLLMKQKKEIYVSAYNVNWLKWFLSRFVDVKKITFLTEIPKGIKSGLDYLKKWKLKEWKKYRKIDSIIIWWGEILTEENSNSYRYRLVSILPCCFTWAKIYLMWGIQIPQKKANKFLFDFLLRKTERIYARDNECVAQLKNYGFKNVEFFMDTAYFSQERKKIQNAKLRIRNKYIVVNLNKNAEKFLDEVVEDLEVYVNRGYDIYFVPVSKGVNEEYDDMKYAQVLSWKQKAESRKRKAENFCKIPAAKLGAGMTVLDREEDFGKFLKILKWAEMVFTGRLHLFMIAKFLGVKVKVYPYQKKILKMQKVLGKIK